MIPLWTTAILICSQLEGASSRRLVFHGSPIEYGQLRPVRKIVRLYFCVDLFQSPAVLLDCELALVNGNFSYGVVPSILEPFQAAWIKGAGLRPS